jgi:hypothetical protein
LSANDPTPGTVPKRSPLLGRAVDIVFPVALSNLIFFGLQADLNAGGGIQIQLGMVTLLKILLICAVFYSYVIRRLFKKLWPHWWGN